MQTYQLLFTQSIGKTSIQQVQLAAMITGLVSALVLVILSPNVWNPEGTAILTGTPLFPLTNPAIISVPLGFLAGWIGSLVGAKSDAKKYAEVEVKANTGLKTNLIIF